MANPESTPRQAAMMQMINGKLLLRCVSLVAELAIADHLKNGSQDVGSLAASTCTSVDALDRILRIRPALAFYRTA
jgi:hypothetical protein